MHEFCSKIDVIDVIQHFLRNLSKHATRSLPVLACGISDASFSEPGMDPLMIKGDACSSTKDVTAISELKEDDKMVRIVRIYKINM